MNSNPQLHIAQDSQSLYKLTTISLFHLAELPPPQMMNAAKSLIQFSVDQGHLAKSYKLLGHRQVRDTECPGQRLYDDISTWSHYSSKPAAFDDPEIAD